MKTPFCGKRLVSARKMAGLSQQGLAGKLGMSKQALSKLETGKTALSYGHVRLLEKVLGRPASFYYPVEFEIVFIDH